MYAKESVQDSRQLVTKEGIDMKMGRRDVLYVQNFFSVQM